MILSAIMILSVLVAIMLWNTIIAVAWAFLFAKTVTTLINYYSLMVAIEHPYSLFLKHIMAPFAVGVVLFVLVLCYNRQIIHRQHVVIIDIKDSSCTCRNNCSY